MIEDFSFPLVYIYSVCLINIAVSQLLDVLVPEEEGHVPAQVDAVGVVVDGGAW